MSVYPNPANDYLMMTIPVADVKGQTFVIMDVTGKIVQMGLISDENMVVDINDLPPGFYTLQTIINNSISGSIFIKQ